MGESSIVSLVISAVGIFTIYLMAKATLRKDVERVTVLRFVEIFEVAIQGVKLVRSSLHWQIASGISVE